MASTTAHRRRTLLKMCAAETIGTALLLVIGLSIVIIDLGRSSPLATLVPSLAGRRAITGLAFGATGMTIALSRVGTISGAHLNPVVSIAFWIERKLSTSTMMAFVASQLLGAVIGSVPLLMWGARGRSVDFAATSPGSGGVALAFLGETITTFALILLLFVFVSHARLRRFTPGLFPPLYCVMVWLEAPWSGTSTNPARSLGPDVITLATHHYWLYWAAPIVGTLLALTARRALPVVRDLEIDIAKVAHFEIDHAAELRLR